MKKYLFIVLFAFVLFSCPTVFASNSWNGTASVGRSAVLDTSNNYYYTDWKLLSSNSLNIIPVPYSGGQYYHMGAEYSFPFTAMGDTTYVVQFRVPVVSNTIYNYTLMNGLNQSDVKVGIDKDFSVYNVNWAVDNINWECSTYPSLGVAHNYCYYDVKVHFTITDPLYGAYNLNFAVLNTTASRSSYYYDGYDSQGCAIEFPNAATGSGYPLMSPSVILNGYSSGGGGNTDTDEITDSIDSASQDIQDAIQESYENLVKSQEVCSNVNYYLVNSNSDVTIGFLDSNGNVVTTNTNWTTSPYISIVPDTDYVFSSQLASGSWPVCFYTEEKVKISCTSYSPNSYTITSPSNSYFIRFAGYRGSLNSLGVNFTGKNCVNGNQALYDSLTDSSFDSHSTQSFFDNIDFYDESTLSAVITAPIDFINSLDDACTPVVLTYRGQSITLPCGNDIFWDRQDVSSFRALWNALFGGLIIYRLVRKLLQVVNDALDPTKDSLGGLDL